MVAKNEEGGMKEGEEIDLCVCLCVRVGGWEVNEVCALDRSRRRKYRMQKTRKQIVNHLLARFLHA